MHPSVIKTTAASYAFPHTEGMLVVAAYSAKYRISFHLADRKEMVMDEDLVEIRKSITDCEGHPHVSRSYAHASHFWCALGEAEDVLWGDTLKAELDKSEVIVLTPPMQFSSDSRGNFVVGYNSVNRLIQGEDRDWITHHDHHSGGDIEILWVDYRLCVRAVEHPEFDTVLGETIDSDEPILFDLNYDLWTYRSIANSHQEFWEQEKFDLPLPIVFSCGGEPAEAQPGVRFIDEPWTPKRAGMFTIEG